MKKVIIKYEFEDSTEALSNDSILLDPSPDSLVNLKSIKAYLVTDEPVEKLEEVNIELDFEFIGKIYLLKTLDPLKHEWSSKYIEKLKRKYENKPNFWERIFGFDDKV